jgi:hypothetical protein
MSGAGAAVKPNGSNGSGAVDARLIKAKRREIAIRYRNGDKKPVSMSALRCAELNRLFSDRYDSSLPDDDAGRDDIRIMVHHLALMSGDQRARMKTWLSTWAPWMSAEQTVALTDAVIAKPIRWRADKLAERLNLRETDRARLSITTIGAVDMTKAEREAARKARMRQAKLKARRTQGVKSRTEYEQQSISRAKPWEAEGISRPTWYRRNRQAIR